MCTSGWYRPCPRKWGPCAPSDVGTCACICCGVCVGNAPFEYLGVASVWCLWSVTGGRSRDIDVAQFPALGNPPSAQRGSDRRTVCPVACFLPNLHVCTASTPDVAPMAQASRIIRIRSFEAVGETTAGRCRSHPGHCIPVELQSCEATCSLSGPLSHRQGEGGTRDWGCTPPAPR